MNAKPASNRTASSDRPVSEELYLQPTAIMDSRHPAVQAFARKAIPLCRTDPVERAVSLFYAVRDQIRYDPYMPFYRPEHYRASTTLASGRGFCVGKAALLCTLGRAVNIPSRLGFADLRNHLAPQPLLETLGADLFVYHGYTEFWLHGRWVKATPAFNAELFWRQGAPPVAFDGCHDAVLPAQTDDGSPFIEYLQDHGYRADVPVAEIVAAWRRTYGNERVDGWIAAFEAGGGMRQA
ncbi:MAG: transglutaminase-like domain-containing protein [Desulfobacteraceae bacterium]|jgi:transglutaminase-like putative cysteine protease|nr:transglutaminase-like domain-containing protein [Desulfobacteraceae bacterium]